MLSAKISRLVAAPGSPPSAGRWTPPGWSCARATTASCSGSSGPPGLTRTARWRSPGRSWSTGGTTRTVGGAGLPPSGANSGFFYRDGDARDAEHHSFVSLRFIWVPTSTTSARHVIWQPLQGKGGFLLTIDRAISNQVSTFRVAATPSKMRQMIQDNSKATRDLVNTPTHTHTHTFFSVIVAKVAYW